MPMVQFLDLTDVDAVLHQWLRDLGNMEKIIYRFNARDKFPKRTPTMEAGVKMTKEAALAVQLAKLNFREEALEKLQLILDTPDPAGHGGSSDDGNAAKKFFGYDVPAGIDASSASCCAGSWNKVASRKHAVL